MSWEYNNCIPIWGIEYCLVYSKCDGSMHVYDFLLAGLATRNQLNFAEIGYWQGICIYKARGCFTEPLPLVARWVSRVETRKLIVTQSDRENWNRRYNFIFIFLEKPDQCIPAFNAYLPYIATAVSIIGWNASAPRYIKSPCKSFSHWSFKRYWFATAMRLDGKVVQYKIFYNNVVFYQGIFSAFLLNFTQQFLSILKREPYT